MFLRYLISISNPLKIVLAILATIATITTAVEFYMWIDGDNKTLRRTIIAGVLALIFWLAFIFIPGKEFLMSLLPA